MPTKKKYKRPIQRHIQFKPGIKLNLFLEGRAKAWKVPIHEAAKRACIIGGLAFDTRHHSLLAQLASMHSDRHQPFVSACWDAATLIAGAEEEERVRRGLDEISFSPIERRDALQKMVDSIKAAKPNALWSVGKIA